MKKWQKRLMQLVKELGFSSKMEAGQLTADEQKELFTKYEADHGISFKSDREADEDDDEEDPNVLSPEDQQQLASIFGEDNTPKSPKQAVPALANKVKEQEEKIEKLGKVPEPPTPIEKVTAEADSTRMTSISLGRIAHTSTHLFGIEDPLFVRGKWYNDITISRKSVGENLTDDDKDDFQKSFKAFANQVISRSRELESNNMLGLLNFDKLVAGESVIDYSDLFEKAGEYIVRRSDLIIAYLRSLPTPDHVFPMRSNIQNKEVAPGANFGELSQGYRKGEIYKGNVNFTAEIYSVTDVMFKFLFEDLIKLEKQYIGYLNKEGSNVIKWSFIEWIMVHFGEILHNERNMRRVVGVHVPDQDVVANPAMFAADGALRAIERVEEELKVYPNPDFRVYDETTIVEYYESFWDFYTQIIPSMVGYKLYANLKHRPWYIRQFRKIYGKDTDFNGVTAESINDVDANIVWIPNMPMNNYKTFIVKPGNVENHEDKPNEMMGFYFERVWEFVRVMSRWKEGAGLQMAGIQYKTLDELIESEYYNQWIFTNFPATELEDGATSIDARKNYLFLTGKNAAATAITDIVKSKIDTVYKIVCGDIDNATTIAKSGKFAKITEAWNPKAVGDYIKVYAELEDYTYIHEGETVKATRPTGNFLELERKVSN